MSYSLDPVSDNCYPGTSVLINKLGIQAEDILDEVEATIVSAKSALWDQNPLQRSFDFAHYRSIHRYLFEDLYDWAGNVRTVDISKKGTRFCPYTDIDAQASAIFRRLHKRELFANLGHEEFVSEIIDFYNITNHLHPFREGNGRTQRLFITQLIRNAGYSFDFADVDGDLLMIATIQAANGVKDLLCVLFDDLITY